jgi:hypothetical protein
MAYVKCRYVEMNCLNHWCPWKEDSIVPPRRFECEAEEDYELVTCIYAEPQEAYIEGEYKRVKWDGAVLVLGRKKITSHRKLTYYGHETDAGIHYLEIDGHVYVDDDEEGDS